RGKAASVGLRADEYRVHPTVGSGWTGMAEVPVSAETVSALYAADRVPLVASDYEDLAAANDLPCHTGLVLQSPRSSTCADHARQAGSPHPGRPGGVRL